ncbi:glycosyl transferase family 1 [Thioalkalivibrio denitrificans]|uniref:Glycosyl transferase family 1 n=1 Tax=Thioalkalivibrio denitrificans TaxID=108003 RepID=A0A1V3NC58_9GAMM|nr:glycosyltransferase [Thioalkalivibrio denitrificans]OOG22432.1 glycosyl transferase family 1 [Thioalkalivibrio denitrificans]
MSRLLEAYARVAGEDVIDHLSQLAAQYRGMKVVHVNSTRVGGGVAEILDKLVPLSRELGLDARWEVITGDPVFYQCTKAMHNGLQGNPVNLEPRWLEAYEETNRHNAEQLRPILEEADVVFIHDPQPAALLGHFPKRRGKWVWRCHIDASRPYRPVWRYLRRHVSSFDASVFSLAGFAQALPHPEYLIPPSIDPLSDKNVDLPEEEIAAVRERFHLDPERPLVTQVSRFDRFKDPVGVIRAYRLAKRFVPGLQLVLAGGTADDDPEGETVISEVRAAAGDDADVHVLLLPPDAHRVINALQRASDLVIQKSTREGFGLTVTEAMWKGRPVIGGDTGGIRLQVVDFHTGFLVSTPEGAALRMRYLLNQPRLIREMGAKARTFVRENFLLTRQLREYLTLGIGVLTGKGEWIELG